VAFNGSYFSTNRMARQYTRNAYYPVKLIERVTSWKKPPRAEGA
jgi:hypothetical protein